MSDDRRNGPDEGAAPKSWAGQHKRTADPRQSHWFATPDDADDRTMFDVAVRSCALAGCTCSPTIKLWRAERYLRVEHEDTCAVLAGEREPEPEPEPMYAIVDDPVMAEHIDRMIREANIRAVDDEPRGGAS